MSLIDRLAALKAKSLIDATPKDWRLVPRQHELSLRLWVDEGVRPGAFLTAVLQNDLKGAVLYADHENTSGLKGLVFFIHEYCPALCHGSRERFAEWPARVQALEFVAEGAAATGVEA